MIILDNTAEHPLYIQIYKQIKKKIIEGDFTEGHRLPSTRELSKTLNVSRNTVDAAYLQLSSEGYIRSKRGSGFTVEKIDNHLFSNLVTSPQKKDSFQHKDLEKEIESYEYDFQYGKLSVADFPVRLWRKLINQSFHKDTADLTAYSERKGNLDLRIEIMKYLNQYRGVNCNPEQIILCAGTQFCLGLLCQLFRNDFTHMAMEDPGYDGARDVFLNFGYQIEPIGLDSDGLCIQELENSKAKLLYMTPSHQFPMGYVTPIQKRLELLDWAVKNQGFIIEDDYDSELRYSGRPIPSLQCIDYNERVIYTGTFSKALSPALRVSYLVLPEPLLKLYDTAFKGYDTSVPWILQKTLEQFMNQGHWENHLKKICLSYKKKHDLLIKTIEQNMGDQVIIHGKNAGLHILLEVEGYTEKELIDKAMEKKVKVYPVSPYWIRTDLYKNNFIQLGFSSLTEEDIVKGVAILSEAWFGSMS